MEALEGFGVFSVTHGSIARGDVSEESDIDIFIPEVVSSFIVETALERSGIPISKRVLVQATPTYSIKAYIEIDERRSVSFPLSKLRRKEREFYRFGGEATLEMLRRGARSPGVDKRLMLIEPTSEGHIESSIVGREGEAAKILGVSLETVLDRVRALMRRDEVGRTGLFIERELLPDETFESALKELAERKPAVRRRLRTV
ncbi:MAG: DNA polymerase subunit beta [Candidatus Bathyarchaeota archaeon B63]|nr:MAG: DNA polymerase subunit beta [Candidatus Bathyarchaeota archaeon B63]